MSDSEQTLPFLDTNIFLRFVLNDSLEHTPACTRLISRVEVGQRSVQSSQTVVFEAVFTLQSFYKVPRDEIRASLLPLLEMEGLFISHS